jgi:hypothetical protein
MIEATPRWPRSNYPKFNNKKFDYSRDSNLDAYLKTADRLGLYIMKVGPDKLDTKKIESVINKIIAAETIHEMTLYADVLWDAYNSYDITLNLLCQRALSTDKNDREKLILLVQYLKMDTGQNRRPILGKHYKEIDEDALHFRKIAIDTKNFIIENSK